MHPVGKLWQDAWKAYADHFETATQIMVPPMLLLGLGTIFQAFGYPVAIAGVIISIIGVLFSIVSSAALVYSFHHKTDFNESYQAGGRLFSSLLWLTILLIFAVLGASVMLIIPGIWLAIALIFANFAVILEGKRGLGALTQSREYSRGYWWAIFGRVVLLVVSILIVYAIVSIPFVLVGGMIGRGIVSALSILFITPFSVAYYYSMYRNMIELKPHVHGGHATNGKTFIVIAQIVAVIFVILVSLGLLVGSISGTWVRRARDYSPYSPYPYQRI